MCVDRKFGLEEISEQRSLYRSGRTHTEHVEDSDEFQPPGGNCLFIVLRVEMSREYVPFTPLDDAPLNIGHSPTIEGPVSGSPRVSTPGPTYVVNCSIASSTG